MQLRKRVLLSALTLGMLSFTVLPAFAVDRTVEGTPDDADNCYSGGSGCTITIHDPDPDPCPECVEVRIKAAYNPSSGILVATDFYEAAGYDVDIPYTMRVNYSLTGRDITDDVNTYYPSTNWSTNDYTDVPSSPGH